MLRRVCLPFVLATALMIALPLTAAFSQPLCQPYLVIQPKCRDYTCVHRGWCYSELFVGMFGAPQNLIWGCLETRCVARVKLPTWYYDPSAPVGSR
jgi:hypothetical protein